jgi:3',5'-cyclic-AMP phosphodiesterase
MGGMLVIAHLSDTHFGGPGDPAGRVRRVLEHLARHDPPVDVVLVTGDIADHGAPEEYAEATAVLGEWRGPAPLLLCPGNHDVRPAYAEMRGLSPDRPCDEAHLAAGHLFLMLDSLVPAAPGERIDHGVLAAESLAWLDGRLGARRHGERAFVCLHHPPEPIHLALMDPIRLENAPALAEVLDRHDDIVAVLVGHAHSACSFAFATMQQPLPVLIPGGVVSTVTMDAEPLEPITTALPPTYAVHHVADDPAGRPRMVTHWRSLPMP